MTLHDALTLIASDARKTAIDAVHLRGILCYRCGRSTLAQSYVREVDGHVRHVECPRTAAQEDQHG